MLGYLSLDWEILWQVICFSVINYLIQVLLFQKERYNLTAYVGMCVYVLYKKIAIHLRLYM